MSDKEMNLAILNKLYEIAFAVWEKMAKVADYGSYTASEIANKVNKEFCFSNEQNEDEKTTVSVGTYTCSFPLKNIFYFVSVFEKLASVGRNAMQFVFEESGELFGKATFEVSKGMSELCKFVADDELRPVMNYIILDAANNCLVASDGHKLLSFPTKVLEHSGDLYNFYICPKKFALMCKKMKKGEIYNVTATKESVNGKECNKLEFDGIVSNIGYIGGYPNWKSVFPKVSNELALHFDKNAWNEIKKFCKVAKKDGANTISLHGLSGESKITLSYDDCKRELAIENKLQHTFEIVSFMIKSIIAFDSVDTLYLGKSSSHAAVATNSLGNIYLLMPAVYEGRGYSVDTRYVPFDIDVLEERANECTNEPTEDVIPAKVDNVTTEEKECATEDKTEQTDFKRDITSKIIICGIPSYKDSAPAKDVAEAKVDAPDAPAKIVPLDKPSNKFSFDAIGVNVGDKLAFIDGTEVIAAEDNKVSFCGELFTLSGFCKEFMPDDKRTKSNSYRGCAFFFKDGVKLEKLFKNAQKKSLVSSKEEKEIAAVPDDTPSEPIDWKGKVFIDFKNKLAYKVSGYNTIKYPHYLYTEIRADGSFLWHGGAEKSEFEEMISHCMVIEYTDENTIMDMIHTYLNSVPNEHQASEKCTERTIIPLAKENVSEHKEMASTAKVVAISIGVPVCLYIPPNNMRLDIAANKPLNVVVGDCLCGVGKVVHTLPLPPPRSKEISELITYTNFYNTS
nr:MAG TPA: DNA polymerase sliding clamp [Bacteriophage sp.]